MQPASTASLPSLLDDDQSQAFRSLFSTLQIWGPEGWHSDQAFWRGKCSCVWQRLIRRLLQPCNSESQAQHNHVCPEYGRRLCHLSLRSQRDVFIAWTYLRTYLRINSAATLLQHKHVRAAQCAAALKWDSCCSYFRGRCSHAAHLKHGSDGAVQAPSGTSDMFSSVRQAAAHS